MLYKTSLARCTTYDFLEFSDMDILAVLATDISLNCHVLLICPQSGFKVMISSDFPFKVSTFDLFCLKWICSIQVRKHEKFQLNDTVYGGWMDGIYEPFIPTPPTLPLYILSIPFLTTN